MYERFTDRARKAMQLAGQEAQRFGHEYVGTEHVLIGLLAEGSGVAANVLKNLDVDLAKLRAEVQRLLRPGPDAVAGTTSQTPLAKKVVEFAVEEARTLGHGYVGTEHLLLGLLRTEEGAAAKVLAGLGLKTCGVREEVLCLLGPSAPPPAGRDSLLIPPTALEHLGRDLSRLARGGEFAPCVGRETDLATVVRVLSRQTKNKPLLLGESGAGKTAVVRGLACLLADPRPSAGPLAAALGEHRVVSVRPADVVAGTKFEAARVHALAAEARAEKVILALDDLHQWASCVPAALALAVALETVPYCVAAATPEGYARLEKKVGSLGRLFRPVRLSRLSSDDVVRALSGLRERFEAHHRVRIEPSALTAAVGYGSGDLDAAIELLDEAAAWSRERQPTAEFAALDAEIVRLLREKGAALAEQDFEKAADAREEVERLQAHRQALTVVDEAAVRDSMMASF